MKLREWYLKNYQDKDFYLRRKAEYSFLFILTMLGAILLIIATEMYVNVDIIGSVIRGSLSLFAFLFILLIIQKERYELGVNTLILLGFARMYMIYDSNTPIQFMIMGILILISVSVIHTKPYQFHITNFGVLAFVVQLSVRLRMLYNDGLLDKRVFMETVVSFYLIVAIIYLLKYIRDLINKEIEEHENLSMLAERDSLTSIYNRRKISELFYTYRQNSGDFQIILFDIDNFKQINDTYGHDVGDQILISLTSLIQKHFPQAIIGRWGGEEFLIISKRDNDLAENIRKTIFNHKLYNNLSVTVSIGQTIVRKNDLLNRSIKRVDDAMYYSKRTGKNKVTTM